MIYLCPASQSQSDPSQQIHSDQFRPARCQQRRNPPSQRALPGAESATMLVVTEASLVGLCFCLLAFSAAAPPSSTIFCCTFLPLLLFGCPLIARFLIPSQAKPVAVKRHRKRVRLKTDRVANDSIGTSVQEAQALPFCHIGCSGTSVMTAGAARGGNRSDCSSTGCAVSDASLGQQRPSLHQWV